MDNFSLIMVAEGDETFIKAFNLFNPAGSKVCGYREDIDKEGSPRLIFYWAKSDRPGYTKMLYPMEKSEAAAFALGWLKHANYGPQPDHDGDNGKGWSLYNESWGHVNGEWEAFAAVSPVWAMYGK